MMQIARDAYQGVDLILLVTERRALTSSRGDAFILQQLKDVKTPIFLVINKIISSTIATSSAHRDVISTTSLRGIRTGLRPQRGEHRGLAAGHRQYLPAGRATSQRIS